METGYANTAALISFSVQQNADGMLNLLLTDKAALNTLMSAFVVSAFWDYLAGMIRGKTVQRGRTARFHNR